MYPTNKTDELLQFKKQYEDFVIEGSFKDMYQEQKAERNKNISTKTTWIPHGFFRKINDFGDVEFFGCFIDGRLKGKCWKSLAGGKF